MVFTVGLLVSGLTSLAASDDSTSTAASVQASQSMAAPDAISRSN